MSDPESSKPNLPFNNLFLNSGLVHGRNKWWMYLAGILATVFGYALFQFIISVPLMQAAMKNGYTQEDLMMNPAILFDPEKLGINKNIMLALLFGMFIFAFFALYTVVVLIHHKPFLSIITPWQKLRYRRVFFGFGVWGGLLILQIAGAYLFDPGELHLQFDAKNFFLLLLVTVFILPFQTSTEEFIFRGYLAQGLALLFKNGLAAMILTSLLFGLLHMDNPEAKAHGWGVMLPYYSLFGLFLGILTLVDEGMELALGVHCANNMISALLITTPNSVIKTDAVFMVKEENPEVEILIWAVFATITFIIFWLRYRWKNFNLILK